MNDDPRRVPRWTSTWGGRWVYRVTGEWEEQVKWLAEEEGWKIERRKHWAVGVTRNLRQAFKRWRKGRGKYLSVQPDCEFVLLEECRDWRVAKLVAKRWRRRLSWMIGGKELQPRAKEELKVNLKQEKADMAAMGDCLGMSKNVKS